MGIVAAAPPVLPSTVALSRGSVAASEARVRAGHSVRRGNQCAQQRAQYCPACSQIAENAGDAPASGALPRRVATVLRNAASEEDREGGEGCRGDNTERHRAMRDAVCERS